MDEHEMTQAMMDLMNSAFEAAIDDEVEVPMELQNVRDMRTFENAGVLTSNAGFVIRMRDGAEYQVTLVRSRQKETESMSTRSLIARRTEEGKYEAVYCHLDGTPEHHMPILDRHYADDEAVEKLLALGDLSILGTELGQKHDFRTHGESTGTQDWCLAYERDRGDRTSPRRTYADDKELLADADRRWAAYIYLFQDGRWVWRKVHGYPDESGRRQRVEHI